MGRVMKLLTNQKPCIILAVMSALLLLPAHSFKIVQIRSSLDGAPQRPEHFRSVDELNKYLTELTDYYTVLGRPRFGKRSGPPLEELLSYPGYDVNKRETQREADPRLSLALAELLLSQEYDGQR